MLKKILFITLLSLLSIQYVESFNFMSIGDWGCVPIGGYHEEDQMIVAKQFTKAAQELNPRFVLNTGDNFYYCGAQNVSDPVFQTTFENVYTDQSLNVPWFGCLGNHDYGYPGSAESEINYTFASGTSKRWIMPNRYYYMRIKSNETNISLVVLDSTPCQSPYTSPNPSGWDPCGSVIPGCPGCTFHQNVIKQSCKTQYTWFQNIVQNLPQDDWKILMTHAPAMDIDNVDFVPLIQQAGFHLYINGHVHLLSHYTIDNIGTYVTTGAGCMVRIPGELERPSSCTNYNKQHTCQIVFEKAVAGFTTHNFNSDYTQLTTNFYSYDGKLLHSTTVNK
jgi:tartrate-resistant acid phosphatase type 5